MQSGQLVLGQETLYAATFLLLLCVLLEVYTLMEEGQKRSLMICVFIADDNILIIV